MFPTKIPKEALESFKTCTTLDAIGSWHGTWTPWLTQEQIKSLYPIYMACFNKKEAVNGVMKKEEGGSGEEVKQEMEQKKEENSAGILNTTPIDSDHTSDSEDGELGLQR